MARCVLLRVVTGPTILGSALALRRIAAVRPVQHRQLAPANGLASFALTLGAVSDGAACLDFLLLAGAGALHQHCRGKKRDRQGIAQTRGEEAAACRGVQRDVHRSLS